MNNNEHVRHPRIPKRAINLPGQKQARNETSKRLLDSDRLGQVSREVDVTPIPDSEVIAEELERDDVQQTLQTVHRLGNTDRPRVGRDRLITLIAQNDRRSLPGGDLGEGALDLGIQGVLGHDDDNRHVLIDESKGAVLQFTSEDTLRMHVADFLDLQGTLEAGRVLISTTHEKQGLVVTNDLGQLLDIAVKVKDSLDLTGQSVQAVDDLTSPLCEGDTIFGKLQSNHEQGDVLRGVRLGRSNTDFGSSIDVDTAVSLAGESGTNSVDNTNAEGTTLNAVPQGQDGVSSFTTLADEEADIVPENGGLAIQEITREFNSDRDFSQLLKDGASCDTGVVAGAARNEDDATSSAHDGQVCTKTAKSNLPLVKVDATTHGVDNGLGLLVDLLLHEGVELALHDGGELDLERLDGPGSSLLLRGRLTTFSSAQSVDVQLALGNVSNVIIFEVENTLGVFDDGGGIGGDEELDWLGQTILGHERAGLGAEDLRGSIRDGEETGWGSINKRLAVILARDLDVDEINLELLVRLDTNEKRRSAAGSDDFVGVVGRLENKGKRTFELLQNCLDEVREGGLLLVLIENVFCEDGDGFSISLSLELVPSLLEDEAQLGVVGNDAVVDDDKLGVGIGGDGVAISLRRGSVGGPASVGDGNLLHEGLVDIDGGRGDLLAETGYFANLLEKVDLTGLVAIDDETRRVVSTVLLAS